MRVVASGKIDQTSNSYDWSTDARDSAIWQGLIVDADPARWHISMSTRQNVRAYGDGTTDPFLWASYNYSAHVKHVGYGRVNGTSLVWGGADYHVGNAESDLDSTWTYYTTSTNAFTVGKKVRSSGGLDNYSDDSMIDEVDVLSAGVIRDLWNHTELARLTHRTYTFSFPDGTTLSWNHHVELDVNMVCSRKLVQVI